MDGRWAPTEVGSREIDEASVEVTALAQLPNLLGQDPFVLDLVDAVEPARRGPQADEGVLVWQDRLELVGRDVAEDGRHVARGQRTHRSAVSVRARESHPLVGAPPQPQVFAGGRPPV